MNDSEKPRFMAILNGLMAMKPGKPLTPEGLELYWISLEDWPFEEFKQAAKHLAKSSEFMPNPYHFEQLRKASGMTAGEAFEKARQIVRRLNPREMISHSSGDAKLDSAIRACGGYEALAMCETDNIGFFERRFAEHYETVSDATETRKALPSLAENSPWRLLGETRRIAQ